MLNTRDSLVGKWSVKVITPFGESKADVILDSTDPFVTGTIIGENGSVEFSNGIIDGNKLKLSATVETPIKATIAAEVEINEFIFHGVLKIDEYMEVNITGEKNVNI